MLVPVVEWDVVVALLTFLRLALVLFGHSVFVLKNDYKLSATGSLIKADVVGLHASMHTCISCKYVSMHTCISCIIVVFSSF